MATTTEKEQARRVTRAIREKLGLPESTPGREVLAALGEAIKPPSVPAVAPAPVAASTATAPTAGVDPGVYASNPFADQIAASAPATYRDAATICPPPQLFAEGPLPSATASGLDPALLAGAPWFARHAIADEPNLAAARQVLQDVTGPDGAAIAASDPSIVAAAGVSDYQMRFREWLDAGNRVAAKRNDDQQFQAVMASRRQADTARSQQVAASASTDEPQLLTDADIDAALAVLHDPRDEQFRAERQRMGRWQS